MALEQLLRELAPQVLGPVMRRFRDFAAAEDAVQEAMMAAAMQWPREGVPESPRGWLIQVAARRMTDHLRSEGARRDRSQISEGIELLTAALSKGSIGSYQLQAAIAAVHDEAATPEDTDWPQILALYDLLKWTSDNPMVMLNHAIAAAMVHGPEKGLELVAAIDSDPRMARHYRLNAVRAHLLEMVGDEQNAIAQYTFAAGRTTSLPERDYLLRQAARLGEQTSCT